MSYPKPQASLDLYKDYNSKLKSLKLTPTQRKKLLNSHRQEEIKSLILEKYLQKHRFPLSELKNPKIQTMMSDFLLTQKLTEKSLANLFQSLTKACSSNIVSQTNTKKLEENTVSQQLPNHANDENHVNFPNDKDQMNEQFEKSNEDSDIEQKSVYKAQDADNEWSMIVKYRQRKYEDDLKASMLKEKQKKEHFKEELDRQLALKKELSLRESQKNEIFETRIQDFIKKQEDKLGDKLQKKHVLLEKEQKARDELFKEFNNRMRREKKQEAEFDRSLVLKAKQELMEEQERQRKKKLEYQNNLRRIMQENEENRKKATDLEKLLEKESEIKAKTEENEIIVKKDVLKKSNENMFLESKRKDFLKGTTTEKAIQERLERLRMEEVNHLKYQAELANKEKRREEMKRKINEEQKMLLRSSLEHQMKEKQGMKKIEEELNKKQAEFWRKDIEEYHLEEERKKLKAREENMKTMGVVRQQIEEMEKRKEIMKGMNELELMQNKDILKDISKDEDGVSIKKAVIAVKRKDF